MSESAFVRRPLEVVFGLAIAFIVIGLILSVMRWAMGGAPSPFDGSLLTTGLQVLAIFVMVLFGLAVAGIVIWAIFAFALGSKGAAWGGPRDWASMAAISDLKKRYANGLVSREDYMRLLADLEGPQAPPPPSPPRAV